MRTRSKNRTTNWIYVLLFVIVVATIVVALKYVMQLRETFTSNAGTPLKVHMNAFWPDATDGKNPSYFLEFLSVVYGRPVVLGTEDDSELLLESVFGESKVGAKKWKHTYHYSGESDIRENAKDFDVILSGNASAEPPNNIGIPHYGYFLHNMPPMEKSGKRRSMPVKDVVCIIRNPGGEFRNKFLDALDKHFQVTYAGSYKNNIGGPLAADYRSPEFIDYISQFKFVITMENNKRKSYISEKIFHGIRAHNIPVYWGSPRVTEYINPARFIELKDEADIDETIARMKELAANESAWQDMVATPWEINPDIQPTAQNIGHAIRAKFGFS